MNPNRIGTRAQTWQIAELGRRSNSNKYPFRGGPPTNFDPKIWWPFSASKAFRRSRSRSQQEHEQERRQRQRRRQREGDPEGRETQRDRLNIRIYGALYLTISLIPETDSLARPLCAWRGGASAKARERPVVWEVHKEKPWFLSLSNKKEGKERKGNIQAGDLSSTFLIYCRSDPFVCNSLNLPKRSNFSSFASLNTIIKAFDQKNASPLEFECPSTCIFILVWQICARFLHLKKHM